MNQAIIVLHHRCPNCKNTEANRIKGWQYATFDVVRYQCDCGELFNEYYEGGKLKFIIAQSHVSHAAIIQGAMVVIVDKNLEILKEKPISRAATLLTREDNGFKVVRVGTIKATLRYFEDTVFARELGSFIKDEDNDNFVIFFSDHKPNAKHFVLQNKKKLLQTIRLRTVIAS